MVFANPPADIDQWITSDTFKDEHCDFDAIIVKGTPQILRSLGPTTITVGGIAKPRCSRSRMVIASYPYLIMCLADRKNNIIEQIQKVRRGEPQVPHERDQFLIKHPLTMFSKQFASVLINAGVEQIEIRQFAQKGPLADGFELMRGFRDEDPDCDIVFDLGAVIPPYIYHFVTPNSEMVRHNPNNEIKPRYITLTHIAETTYFKYNVHQNAKPTHFPICAIPTLEFFNNSIHPVYGSCYGDFNRYDSDLKKFKVYNTMIHIWKNIYRGDLGKNDTGRIAGRRFAHFNQFLSMLEDNHYCPETRFEVSVKLPANADFTTGLDIFNPALSRVHAIWKSTRAVHLSMRSYISSCRRILDWASSDTLPTELRCFKMRHGTKTTIKKHALYVAIAQCIGFSSEASNVLFKTTYERNENPVDYPFLWLAVQVWRYNLRKLSPNLMPTDDDVTDKMPIQLFNQFFINNVLKSSRSFYPQISANEVNPNGRRCLPEPKANYDLHLHECGTPIHFRDDGLQLDLLEPLKIWQYCTQSSNTFSFGFSAIGCHPPQAQLAQIENQHPDQTPDTYFSLNYLDKFLEDNLTVVSSTNDYRANFVTGGGVAAKDSLLFRLYRKIGSRIYDDQYPRYNEGNFLTVLRFNRPENELRIEFENNILPKKKADNTYVTFEEEGIDVPVAHLYGNT